MTVDDIVTIIIWSTVAICAIIYWAAACFKGDE